MSPGNLPPVPASEREAGPRALGVIRGEHTEDVTHLPVVSAIGEREIHRSIVRDFALPAELIAGIYEKITTHAGSGGLLLRVPRRVRRRAVEAENGGLFPVVVLEDLGGR